jgi:hypothetical protein
MYSAPRLRGQHDYGEGSRSRVGEDTLHDLITRQLWHHEVADNEVALLLLDPLQPRVTISFDADFATDAAQIDFDEIGRCPDRAR